VALLLLVLVLVLLSFHCLAQRWAGYQQRQQRLFLL
jgi:hypothetical protein